MTGYLESWLCFLALYHRERLYLPLLRRKVLSEHLACLTLFLKRCGERLDQPVLRISTLLGGSRCRLCSFRSHRHLLDPLLNLLQVCGEGGYILCLVFGKLLKRRCDLAHLLLYKRHHVPMKRGECFLLLCEIAAHLAYLVAVLLVLPGKRALPFLL